MNPRTLTMPINRNDRIRSRDLLHTLAVNGTNSSVEYAQSTDRYRLPVTVYACVGDREAGACTIDPSFHCELNLHDIGLLVEYLGAKSCRGICELQISDSAPEWVFKRTGSRKLRIPIEA